MVTTRAGSKGQQSGAGRAAVQAGAAASAGAAAAAGRASPAHVDLRCLEGIRAVACLGILCLHCYVYWQFFLPHQPKYELTQRNPAVKLASAGMVWVDVLLLLSAALSAFQLLPQLEDCRRGSPSCGSVVACYWRRRALRILPAYALANVAAAVALGPADAPREAAAARWIHFYHCPRNVWANFLLIQNFLGNKACAIHLWTVALQAQWHLASPLLLWALRPRAPGFRARLAAALAAAALGGTLWRLWAAWRVDFLELPVADFAVDQASQLSWANLLHASYLPTASRVTELAAGAALGALLRSRAALQLLRRRRRVLGAVALALQAAYLYLLVDRHLLFRAPGAAPWPLSAARLHVALLSWGSPFMAALVAAALLALVLHADPMHAAAARLLGAPAWRPVGALSYTLFLMHEQARLWVILLLPPGWLPRFIAMQPLPSLAAVCAGTLAAGVACALPLHFLVERRCKAA